MTVDAGENKKKWTKYRFSNKSIEMISDQTPRPAKFPYMVIAVSSLALFLWQ